MFVVEAIECVAYERTNSLQVLQLLMRCATRKGSEKVLLIFKNFIELGQKKSTVKGNFSLFFKSLAQALSL